MKTLKGPAIFLAQFAGDAAPFNSLDAIAGWAARLGFKGVQIPTWNARLFDLTKAASSKAYCDDISAILAKHGLTLTELSTPSAGPTSCGSSGLRPRFRWFCRSFGAGQSASAASLGG